MTNTPPLPADGSSTLRPSPSVVARATDVVRVFGSGDTAVRAVAGITASFRRGEMTAIVGPSGSGKSTMMHLLAGLDTPSSGTIELDGQLIARLSDDHLAALRHERMGFVFQSFNLLPGLTALENIRLPESLGARQRSRDDVWERELIARLDIGRVLHRRPHELSGGQQQRIAIARALAHRPAVVFADEPTGNLDLATGDIVLRLLSELVVDSGCGVILVTHDPRAASRADRVLALRDGRVVAELGRANATDISALMLADAHDHSDASLRTP
ncbi:putative ABC transport system ATP-binding protein [Microcella putealis]|uniref:Putative ABC transport system ATP-binding protein n=1 Tax=Microcella putealis TaxID=337005 RepID=A0A4Q7LUB2_9MICO|nr:ABC transporter ATP-binding protein [Microcella putealis]RZS57787.1 putative ABC transport system ATP-binding protein [Microcella putealis]TQM24854.1 putative ABC transport system ATP-binding protein [Microcella putealis]